MGPLLGALHAGWVLGALTFTLRWIVALGLLALAVALLVRYGPATPQPAHWVTFGSLLVIVAWVGMSVGFAVYVTQVAAYGSIFVNLASVFILFTYLYLSTIVFLGGIAIDAIVRRTVRLV